MVDLWTAGYRKIINHPNAALIYKYIDIHTTVFICAIKYDCI